MKLPSHPHHTRLARRRRVEATDKVPSETRAVYEFLRADFNTALAKTASERNEATVTALAKLDNKLDLVFGRIDDVKLSIGVDLDELRCDIGVNRNTHVAPSSAPVSPREPQLGSQPTSFNDGPSGSTL
ncbi:hypothetical protein D1007_37917 [Hordeum vulgare]|nr:hypothetical protein D1007_37917 [Hordeum vulgare]